MARPVTLTVKKLISLTPDLAGAIEEFRFAQHINTEAEAIRRLIQLGLDQPSAPAKRRPATPRKSPG